MTARPTFWLPPPSVSWITPPKVAAAGLLIVSTALEVVLLLPTVCAEGVAPLPTDRPPSC